MYITSIICIILFQYEPLLFYLLTYYFLILTSYTYKISSNLVVLNKMNLQLYYTSTSTMQPINKQTKQQTLIYCSVTMGNTERDDSDFVNI